MSNSCNTKTPILNGCNPTITILCIISCFICTVVMIWGTYAMRADMAHMEQMMNLKNTKNQTDPMMDHCREMPNMAGCEQYR